MLFYNPALGKPGCDENPLLKRRSFFGEDAHPHEELKIAQVNRVRDSRRCNQEEVNRCTEKEQADGVNSGAEAFGIWSCCCCCWTAAERSMTTDGTRERGRARRESAMAHDARQAALDVFRVL